MKKNVVVTGASGFVGTHLIPMLIENGYSVTAIIKYSKDRGKLPENVKSVIADLAKKGKWQNSLKGNDFIIHLAAQISAKDPKEFTRNNVKATNNLMVAAKLAKIKKIILYSSAAVSSIRRDPYSKTKDEQEKIIKKSKIQSIIIRPSMIYGPGDTKNIGWLIKLVKKLPLIPLPGGGVFGRQPIFVNDICKITIKLLDKDYGKNIFEIHGKEYITLRKMISTIQKNLRSKKLVVDVPIALLTSTVTISEKFLPNPKFTADQINSLISGEKFKGDDWASIFDIIPTRFEAGVAKMIKSK